LYATTTEYFEFALSLYCKYAGKNLIEQIFYWIRYEGYLMENMSPPAMAGQALRGFMSAFALLL